MSKHKSFFFFFLQFWYLIRNENFRTGAITKKREFTISDSCYLRFLKVENLHEFLLFHFYLPFVKGVSPHLKLEFPSL